MIGKGQASAFAREATAAQTKINLGGPAGIDPALKDIENLVGRIASSPQKNAGGANANLAGLDNAARVLGTLRGDQLSDKGIDTVNRLSTEIQQLRETNQAALKTAQAQGKTAGKVDEFKIPELLGGN